MKNLLLITLFISTQAFAAVEENSKTCTSAKDYITTLEYLREHTSIAGNEKQAREIADHVSKGCTGAAKRFIQAIRLLEKSGVAPGDSVQYAKTLALKNESTAKVFFVIFQKGFARDGFDLDQSTALKLASSLSIDFNADPEVATKDFSELTKFCLSKDGLSLSKPQCAELSARITKTSEKHKVSVSKAFFSSFDFMTSSRGPNITTSEALKYAEELVSIHPESLDNFSQAYRYALDKSGLELSRDEAFKFAMDLAKRTLPVPQTVEKK